MFASNTSQVSADANFIEDVFSTYLFTGNDSSSRLIQNNIDLSTKGGLVWLKRRDGAQNHALYDTERGASNRLISNLTNAQDVVSGVSAFNTTGFTMGADLNYAGQTMASWTFRKQAKFFDVVTYTGNGVNGRQISHALGSVPGCIIVKRTSSTGDWNVYHRSLGNNDRVLLNLTNAAATTDVWFDTTPTSTVFYVDDATLNITGETYVAYLFAHDAGGFGLTGTDNVISCGSFTGNGSSGQQITLGYEPQFIIIKQTNAADTWRMYDNMRGMGVGGSSVTLQPNSSNNESTDNYPYINATGFTTGAITSGTYIYIAIRRGPMRTPTSGTSVFSAQTYSGSGSTRTLDASIVPDLYIGNTRDPAGGPVGLFVDRLRGNSKYIRSYDTAAETGTPPARDFSNQTGFTLDGNADNVSGRTYVSWFFRRAPGFFDEVCYTGTGSATTFSHNLGVPPELMIVKNRNNAENWGVYSAALGNTKRLRLNSTDAAVTASAEWNNTSPTASVFTVGTDQEVNFSGNTYVNYLFATVAGVSKVGSYTGTGTTLQIDCGFTGGARFVLIKRTDSTGDWYVWDSARGIVAGDDPYLLLNSTAAEVTNTDYVDTLNAGFEISSTAPAAINANGGTFIYLAIA